MNTIKKFAIKDFERLVDTFVIHSDKTEIIEIDKIDWLALERATFIQDDTYACFYNKKARDYNFAVFVITGFDILGPLLCIKKEML